MRASRRSAAVLLLASAISAACSSGEQETRRRRPETAAPVDSVIPVDVRQSFSAPADWESVSNPSGLTFQQPPAFTFGLSALPIQPCNDSTPEAEVPILNRGFMEEWPLTVAMRDGDVNRIARTNGFTLDSTEIGTHEAADGSSTTFKRGEGWILLSGRTAGNVSVLFAAVRHPGGCQLVWAARGAELDPDTLGMVLSTVRFTQ